MNKLLVSVIFILFSLILITIQSTFLSPRNIGFLSPDFNLILILFFSLFSGIEGGVLIALGNAYLMDVLSGNILGVHTLSRMSAFTLIQGLSTQFYGDRVIQIAAIFFSTFFSWIFIWSIVKIRTDFDFPFSFFQLTAQAIVNTVVGIPLFWFFERTYAKLQG